MDETRSPATEIAQLENINLVFDLEQNPNPLYPSYYDFDTLKSGPEILAEMGEVCVQEYEEDLLSRSDWEENTATYIKLFTSFMDKKNTPWPDASNICLPLLSIATLQFHARAYDALIPPR